MPIEFLVVRQTCLIQKKYKPWQKKAMGAIYSVVVFSEIAQKNAAIAAHSEPVI
jgi:hypothetical protein